ncbi:hypothetical protein Q9189_008193, partial [Teloschistes chrysophthalmus]
NGKKMGPAFALVGAVNYLYLAYKAYYGETGKRGIGARVGGGMWKSYLGAAVGTVGIVP